MNAEVYLNTGANVPPVNNFSTTNPHPLQLFPEDRIAIHEIFLRHLAQCNLTPRRVRIVLAVFNQTLGFNKFEDDMNGSRLQQLTGIAANHANQAVRDLQQLHVLVTRQGKYGHFLAINFDLAQWGKAYDKAYKPTIDPCFLLPEDAISDTGLDLSTAIEDSNDNDIETISENLDVSITVQHEKAEQQPTEPPAATIDSEVLHELLKAMQTLTEKVAELEKKIDTPPQQTTAPETVPTIPTVKQQTIASETAPSKPTTNAQTTNTNTLRYPSSLSAKQCQQATSILQHANDTNKAQLLLDMLAKRISNQHDPLRDPIRYLATLVEKLNNNQLRMATPNTANAPHKPTNPFVSTTTSVTGEATPELSEAEKIKTELQEATLDCQHMERNITMLAEQDNISFEESLVKFDLTPWWEKAKERFHQAKEAFVLLAEKEGMVVA